MCKKLAEKNDSKHYLEEQEIIEKKNKDLEYKRDFYVKGVFKILIKKENNPENLEKNSDFEFIWNPVNWIFYRWWRLTWASIVNYWILLEFDWDSSERIKISTAEWIHHDIKINEELLELKWKEIWIFRKQSEEDNLNIVLIKAIVVRNNK